VNETVKGWLWAMAIIIVVIALAIILSNIFGDGAPSKPGFYCNGTTAVYYNDQTIIVSPWAPECGGNSIP
jgi:uncharacterized membrane protein